MRQPSGTTLSRVIGRLTGGLLLSLLVTGCGSQATVQDDPADAALLDELLGDLGTPTADNGAAAADSTAARPSATGPSATGPTQQSVVTASTSYPPAAGSPAVPATATARGERLELRLQAGDRFPLVKTVEQTLIQKSQQYPAMARTRLEMTMAIQVEQVRADAILMSVRYSRITYSHDLNGQRLDYDSAVHQHGIPYDVQPYAGMVNNGFAFWVGRDNRIRDVVGYQEFLQRCVEQVPLERRQTLLSEIANRFGDDGVANFIDDSIGLLPYDGSVDADAATRVAPGDVWTRETRLMQPAPVYLTSTYRLVSLDARTAEIDITGRIASGESVGAGNSSHLKISGGHSVGTCTVDRATGLPLELNLTRFLAMVVTLPSGEAIPQEKQIATQIRAFPETRGPVVQQPQMPGSVQPAAASGMAPATGVIPIPTRTEALVPGQAVYPD